MKLLLLIPNFILLFISVYNLINDFSEAGPNYLAFKILHFLVMIMCITFIALIIKSMFIIRLTKITEDEVVTDERYEEISLQHS